jgi:D-alanine-D-alanine ligase-like ATP-grasp enzyme
MEGVYGQVVSPSFLLHNGQMAGATGKHTCVYCGDAPVPHRLQYIASSLDFLVAQMMPQRAWYLNLLCRIEQSRFFKALERLFMRILSALRVATFSSDKASALSERTKIVWTEAERRGLYMETVRLFGKNSEEARVLITNPRTGRARFEYFQSIPFAPKDMRHDFGWVDDKLKFKGRFTKAGLPVASGASVFSSRRALSLFKKLGGPVIVKPRLGSRARHTAVSITDEEDFLGAFRRAKQLCPLVMIEEYIHGTLYRATCVGGKLIGVVRFVKPYIIADGVHTAGELREVWNANKPLLSLTDVEDNFWFRQAIEHQGYRLDSVPEKGTLVLLSEHSERPNGGYFIDVTDRIPESTRQTIERAAVVSTAPVIGFDIISQELESADERFVFIEGNTLPYIELHHIPYEGTVRDVAGAVWDYYLRSEK